MNKKRRTRSPWSDKQREARQKVIRFFIHVFAWIGIAILYYFAFSFFFDTPLEYQMKASTAKLRDEYEVLNERYDSISTVLDNVVERDKNVFRILFESEPYDLDSDYEVVKWQTREKLLDKTNSELADELSSRMATMERSWDEMVRSYESLQQKTQNLGDGIENIPSIQPVVNTDLTLLTASFGLRIHPFYKSLVQHMGVDYTVPEGSRVFATADGRVKSVVRNLSSSGLTVIISHDNGYETQYSHLSKSNVRRGQLVRRGDIIALSGNTGLSLAPHLHYEVRLNGLRIDPIHYFFMELSPSEYRRIINIAKSGMQSFD